VADCKEAFLTIVYNFTFSYTETLSSSEIVNICLFYARHSFYCDNLIIMKSLADFSCISITKNQIY
jgi:hypothetical protein